MIQPDHYYTHPNFPNSSTAVHHFLSPFNNITKIQKSHQSTEEINKEKEKSRVPKIQISLSSIFSFPPNNIPVPSRFPSFFFFFPESGGKSFSFSQPFFFFFLWIHIFSRENKFHLHFQLSTTTCYALW